MKPTRPIQASYTNPGSHPPGERRAGHLALLCLPGRVLDKIEQTESCWQWTGHTRGGYGLVRHEARLKSAHRVVYEALRGPIQDGLMLDHLCRNRGCVNPDHLEAVPHRINVLRGIGPPAQHARKTHCTRGHEFSSSNTTLLRRNHDSWSGLERACRICARARVLLLISGRRQKGLCEHCGQEPAKADHQYCSACLEKNRERCRVRRQSLRTGTVAAP